MKESKVIGGIRFGKKNLGYKPYNHEFPEIYYTIVNPTNDGWQLETKKINHPNPEYLVKAGVKKFWGMPWATHRFSFYFHHSENADIKELISEAKEKSLVLMDEMIDWIARLKKSNELK